MVFIMKIAAFLQLHLEKNCLLTVLTCLLLLPFSESTESEEAIIKFLESRLIKYSTPRNVYNRAVEIHINLLQILELDPGRGIVSLSFSINIPS